MAMKKLTAVLIAVIALPVFLGCRMITLQNKATPTVKTPSTPAAPEETPSANPVEGFPPAGILEAAPVLTSDGVSANRLRLVTTKNAECRWSEASDLSFAQMSASFDAGQGEREHETLIRASDMQKRTSLYVRCRGTDGDNTLEQKQWQASMGMTSPSNFNYPRIGNLWGMITAPDELSAYTGFSLFIPFLLDNPESEIEALKSAHPEMVVLHNQDLTQGNPKTDPIAQTWLNSSPGSPGYGCLFRDSRGKILFTQMWSAPIVNMTRSECRASVIRRNLEEFASTPKGADGKSIYQGIYWDMVFDSISWLGSDIDSDLNGQPDDPAALDAAYKNGMQELLADLRQALPDVILMGNDATTGYQQWLDGRLFEWQLNSIQTGDSWPDWSAVIQEYSDWADQADIPLAILESSPDQKKLEKYGDRYIDKLPQAVIDEAQTEYQRMRFGLASALMGNGIYSFDLGPFFHGLPWWYDEYGTAGSAGTSSLPETGYLGAPTGDRMLMGNTFTNGNQIKNGRFDTSTANWNLWVNPENDSSATLSLSGGDESPAVQIQVNGSSQPWDVRFWQPGISIEAGKSYTLSFWARGSTPQTIYARFAQGSNLVDPSGFDVQTQISTEWKSYVLSAQSAITKNGEIWFNLGETTGTIWLSDIQFGESSPGVYIRPFEKGLALVNPFSVAQTVALPGTYCRVKGDQAPLSAIRIDDSQAAYSAGWAEEIADFLDFGETIHRSAAGGSGTAVYSPPFLYSGEYEVLAWVSPKAGNSSAAPVTIQYAGGEQTIRLDEKDGALGWRSLGKFPFSADTPAHASLGAAGDGSVVADAFKWVSTARFNDGAEVHEVTLQPMDGLVLLNECKGGQ
jgi:hypothetical protein